MKKLTFGSLVVIGALLLSSCQFHTGLGSLLGGKSSIVEFCGCEDQARQGHAHAAFAQG